VSPEQVQVQQPSRSGSAEPWQHGTETGVRALYLGCLILEAGSGPRLAPAVTAGGSANLRGPAVTVRTLSLLAP
jgi:hypothetical protein